MLIMLSVTNLCTGKIELYGLLAMNNDHLRSRPAVFHAVGAFIMNGALQRLRFSVDTERSVPVECNAVTLQPTIRYGKPVADKTGGQDALTEIGERAIIGVAPHLAQPCNVTPIGP